MLVDLVQVTTTDGLRLDGVLQSPQPGQSSAQTIDAIVCVHGTGSNFYGSTLLKALTSQWTESGWPVLRVNTRGHDGISTAVMQRGRCRAGSAYERVDDCRYDFPAWVDFLVQRGFTRIGMVGHSLGALKGIYWLAQAPHPAVGRLVAISPPHLSRTYFRQSRRGAEFADLMARAEGLIAANEGETLLNVSFPLPYVVTAAGYVDKYGTERYDILQHLPRLACPTLVTYGQLEVEREIAFSGMPEAVERAEPGPQPRSVVTIPAADHNYTGVELQLATEIANWLRM